MPLPAVTDALDNVDASHHDLYHQTDTGAFVLDIDGEMIGHPAVAALENAFRKEQEKRKRQGRELDALKEKLAGAPEADVKLDSTRRRDLEELSGQADRYRAVLQSTLIDAALTDALVGANIAAPFLKAAKAMHRNNLAVVEDAGEFRVVAEASGQTLPADQYIAAWAESAEGRAFIAAPRNGGGGAHGSGIADPRSPNPWRPESFNRTEQARIARDDPALAKRLARAAGRPEPRV
jgi:hypothetical protein